MPLSVTEYSAVHTDPCLIFEVENWLDRERFDALAENFPSIREASERQIQNLQDQKFVFDRRSPQFPEFIAARSDWRQFYDDLVAPDFLRECNDIYNKHHGRNDRWVHAGGVLENAINKHLLGRELVDVQLEFSFMRSGAFILPHTDAARKLMTLMLYFPSPKSGSGKNNGTKFWRFAPELAGKYSNFANKKYASDNYPDFDKDAECFYQTMFEGNHLYGFLKSDLSWHSVDSIDVPTGDSRNSVNISITKFDKYQRHRTYRHHKTGVRAAGAL